MVEYYLNERLTIACKCQSLKPVDDACKNTVDVKDMVFKQVQLYFQVMRWYYCEMVKTLGGPLEELWVQVGVSCES